MAPRLQHSDKLYVGGEWVQSLDGSALEIVSPDTEEVVFTVAGAGPRDMDRAVAAARRAFDHGAWSTAPAVERIELVQRLAEALKRRESELAAAWSMQMGGLSAMAGHVVEFGTQNMFDAVKVARSFRFTRTMESAIAQDAQ